MVISERADAARNRAAILSAAADLFDREGTEHVSMSDVAKAAGVGKGTVFRRFGDRNALIAAILQPRAAALRRQAELAAPPLGPGGLPSAALHAFLDALFDFVWENRALLGVLERGGDLYYENPSSRYWLAELTRRLTACTPVEGRPPVDVEYLAHVLFTALRADVVVQLGTGRGMDRDRIRAGLHRLADL